MSTAKPILQHSDFHFFHPLESGMKIIFFIALVLVNLLDAAASHNDTTLVQLQRKRKRGNALAWPQPPMTANFYKLAVQWPPSFLLLEITWFPMKKTNEILVVGNFLQLLS
ncbi:MAG: hypothetical protein Q8807_03420 ['Waltheria sp.' little leaf phytoplasma]|nr:hypothetical protein ['Waltheria sp.' little leaf phytoplasma]